MYIFSICIGMSGENVHAVCFVCGFSKLSLHDDAHFGSARKASWLLEHQLAT